MYQAAPRTFKSPTGHQVTRIARRALAPRSPATEQADDWYSLRDTPTATTDRYAAAQTGGPTGRMRLEIRINGGSPVTLTATGVAVGGTVGVEQTVEIRAVTLASASTDCPRCSWAVWIRQGASEANWYASA